MDLRGIVFRKSEEIYQFDGLEVHEAKARRARARLLSCYPRSANFPGEGILLDQRHHWVLFSERRNLIGQFATLLQPTSTCLEALRREGLEPLDQDSIEAKAWQGVIDSLAEIARLDDLLGKVEALREDANSVLKLRSSNELLVPVRERSRAMIPKLEADLRMINERKHELRCFGYNLYEFLSIPVSLRSADPSVDMESILLGQRGMTDELIEQIHLIETTYAELLR